MLRFLSHVLQSRSHCVLESRRAIRIVPSVAVTYFHPLWSRGIESDFRRQRWDRMFSVKHTVTVDALEAFDVAARELMLKQKVKASKLHERLRNIKEDASKDLPPVEVLYCNSYGGYCYSKQFESFIEEKKTMPDSLATICAMESGPDPEGFRSFIHRSHKDRVRHVQWLAPFGQDIMDKWPGIGQLVQAYMRNDLGKKMNLIQLMLSTEKRFHKILKIREAIAAEIGKINGKTEYCFYYLNGEENFKVYAPSALEEMRKKCDAEHSKSILLIEGIRGALLKHLTKAQFFAMVESLGTEFAEKHGEIEGLYWAKYEREKLSFIEAIEKYGGHHYAVWQCTTFNEEAMRFLRLHPEHSEQLASQGDDVDCAKTVGLCAAGSQFCNLEIAEVPCMAEWAVSEHDGREKVQIV